MKQNTLLVMLAACILASCHLINNTDSTPGLTSENDVKKYLEKHYPTPSQVINRETDYDIALPYTEGDALSNVEKALLLAYLDHPSDLVITKNLADLHTKKSVVHGKKTIPFNSQNLRHTILARYFFERAVELGDTSTKTSNALATLKKSLDTLFNQDVAIDNDGDRESHKYFINAFNYEEKNRHIAYDKLLADFVAQPGNVFTAFYIKAASLWNGSESAYDDPTILYDYVISSFFSAYSTALAQNLEKNWTRNPEQYSPFRLAHVLGGVGIVQRRWMATLHNDQDAIRLIDEEHWAWYEVSPIFHGYTLAVTFFDDPQTHPKAFQAIVDGMMVDCFKGEDIRTCKDSARLSFNTLGVTLSIIDYIAKMGDPEKAKEFMHEKYNPEVHYADWDLGRPAWEYREKNIDDLARRFSNDDPNDDPVMFGLKAKKWGISVLTCQYCHQAQSRQWTLEEKNYIQLPAAGTAKLAQWPTTSVTWYGTVKR